MRVAGRLYDTRCDGHIVYLRAKVEGYGYTTLWRNDRDCGTYRYGSREVYDPQAAYVRTGTVQVCVDIRYRTDPCTSEEQWRTERDRH